MSSKVGSGVLLKLKSRREKKLAENNSIGQGEQYQMFSQGNMSP